MPDVAVLTARLEGDVRDFDRDMKTAEKRLNNFDKTTQTTAKSTKGLGSQFSTMAQSVKGAAIAGLAVGAAGAIMKTVDAASNLEESLNAVKVTFGPYAAEINKLGEASDTAFGMSQRSFNEFAVQFSAFGDTIATGSGKKIHDVIGDITTRVADFASVMNLDVAEAQTVFMSGLAGETEAFRRFGVDVSAAAVEQKALALGLGTTSKELTEQDKILARYELIMDQTNKTAGDFANTSDSLANQQRILNARLEDLQATVGQAFLPAVSDVTGGLADMTGVIDNLLGKLDQVGGSSEGKMGNFIQGMAGSIPLIGPIISGVDLWSDAMAELNNFLGDSDEKQVTARDTGRQYLDMLNGQARKADDAARANSDLAGAVAEVITAQREAASPALALFNAQDKVAQATERYNDAVVESGPKSQDAITASVDLAQAQLELDGAAAVFAQDGGAKSIEALEDMLRNAGLTEGAIRDAITAIKDFNNTPVVPIRIGRGGEIINRDRGSDTRRAAGGPVRAGIPYLVGERGAEMFVPDSGGQIVPNHALGGGGSVYNVYVTAYGANGRDLGQMFVSEIRKYEKRNGPGWRNS